MVFHYEKRSAKRFFSLADGGDTYYWLELNCNTFRMNASQMICHFAIQFSSAIWPRI